MKSGQTLVMLLVFVAISVVIVTATTAITLSNSASSSRIELGQIAYNIAESGVENALMRLLRNPSYSGETLTVDTGTATITISGTNPYLVTSVGTYRDFVRQLTATVEFTGGVMAVTSWQEIY